jgi:hypothetical protein
MKYKLVYIEWEDSYSGRQGWYSLDEALIESREAGICKSIGYLIVDDTNCVVIAQSMGIEDVTVHNTLHIPKVLIKKRKTIKL